MTDPLSGVKVLDFGIYAAGPMCSVALGDLGADVIRVEPIAGEPLRNYFRGYRGVNRGKRVIALNLKAPEAAGILDRMTAAADVVHYNYRPGVAARLGIDADTLLKRRPDMIVLDAPGYGLVGPKAHQPAFDMILQGFTGHESRLGGTGNDPLWSRLAFVDTAAGMIGANAVLAMLYRRARTGKGGLITVSLLDTAVYMMSELVRRPDGSFAGADMLDAGRLGNNPARSIYRTADGWVAIVVYGEAAARSLSAALSLGGQLPMGPESWDAAERALIGRQLAESSTKDIVERLRAAGIWIEPCRDDGATNAFADALLRELGAVITGEHPRFGALTQIGPLVHFSESSPDLARRAHISEPGGETRAILQEYGYAADEIDSLYAKGVIA